MTPTLGFPARLRSRASRRCRPRGDAPRRPANPRLLEQARELETLLAKDPNNYDHLVQLANTQYDLNDFVKAADYYEKARAIKDDSPDVLTDLGVCYKETGKAKEALELFDRAADMRPDHWQSRYNAAVVEALRPQRPRRRQQSRWRSSSSCRGRFPASPT